MFRTLRTGGIVIRDELVCTNEISLKQLVSFPGLVEIDYRLKTSLSGLPTHVFQKVLETSQP